MSRWVQMTRRPRLGVVSPMSASTRKHLMVELADEFDCVVIADYDADWTVPYRHDFIHLSDRWQLVHAVASSALDGILTWDESWVTCVAQAAESLGLPGPSSHSVRLMRDKARVRRIFSTLAGVKDLSGVARDRSHAEVIAARIGYPVIVKPTGLAGSRGVIRVDQPSELPSAFDFCAKATVQGFVDESHVMVESYLEGQEISVDCAVFRGDVSMAYVAHKHLGYAPYFEEIGHTVNPSSSWLNDLNLVELLESLHKAIGFDHGWSHSEWRLTKNGPMLIEVNPRIGGDLISLLGRKAAGVHGAIACARLALGLDPDVRPVDRGSCFGLRFVYPEQPMRYGGVSTRSAFPHDRVSWVSLPPPGTDLFPPPTSFGEGRCGYLLASGATVAETENALETGLINIDILGHPVEEC